MQLHPADAVIKQPILVEVLGDGDAPLVFSGHLPGELAVRELLPEQDKLVGLEPVGDSSLLHVEVLVLGRLGYGGQEGEQYNNILADPGEVKDCSTNTLEINS